MKRVFLAIPLALLLTNCNTQKSTTTNDSMGSNITEGSATMSTNSSATDGSTSTTGSMGTDNPSTSTGTTGTSSRANGSGGVSASGGHMQGSGNAGVNAGSTYNPNNFMQNPDKYRSPAELGSAGGWTYNTDWRVNTNFKPEAVGQWQLLPTTEVSLLWHRDTTRPETFSNYWTPEAINARNMEQMSLNAKRADSLAMINGTGSLGGPTNSMRGTTGSGTISGKTRGTMNSTGHSGTTSNMSTTGNMNATGSMGTTGNIGATGSIGTTGNTTATANMGTTGNMNATGTTDTTGNLASGNVSASHNMGATGMYNLNSTDTAGLLTATNGNQFMKPRLSLFLENGTITGYTGCNSISGKVLADGNKISFQNVRPSTMLDCTGGFDQNGFLERLRRADSYEVAGEQLQIKQGSEILFVMSKNNDQNSPVGANK